VVDVDAEHPLEVPPVEDQEPVEAFGAGGADEALGDRVRPRCSDRCADDLQAFASEDGVEVAGELAVTIADEKAQRRGMFLERPGELASLLRYPRRRPLRNEPPREPQTHILRRHHARRHRAGPPRSPITTTRQTTTPHANIPERHRPRFI
jgi:hypothetical protein